MSFAISYELIPSGLSDSSKDALEKAYKSCSEDSAMRAMEFARRGRMLEVHAILAEIMKMEPNDPVWGGKRSAREWYASASFLV